VQATLDANFLPTDMQFLAFLEKTTNAMYHLWIADTLEVFIYVFMPYRKVMCQTCSPKF